MKNSLSTLLAILNTKYSLFSDHSITYYKRARRTWTIPRYRRKFYNSLKLFSVGVLKSFLLLFLILDLSVAPLMAQPTLFRDLWRNGSDGKLERQYQNAENSQSESDWDKSLKKGKDLLKADWEARADEEIDRELVKTGKQNDTTAKADLERDKQVFLQQWESEVQTEIDSRKGEWKARIASSSLTDLIANFDKDALRQAVIGAENASKTGTNASEKVQLFDQALSGVLGAFRADWEDQLDTRLGGLTGSVTFGNAVELNSFLNSLNDIKSYFLSEYYYEESSIVASFRAGFVARENRNDDLNSQIAQETDPSKLALLLIDRAKKSIDQNFAGIVPQNGTVVVNQPNLTVEGADKYQTEALKALEEGQKQWQTAIDDLLLGKLRFDRESELARKNGEADWTDAYGQLLKAREDWMTVVKGQIQKGLEAWDTSENNLQQNKQTALAELDRTLATGREQWQAHVRGVESVVLGGADTLTTIATNKQFFQEALDRANKPNSGYNSTIISEYNTQLTYWTNLEGRVRTLVANAQNSIHDSDIRGTAVGQGLLVNAGGADNYIYTTAELELRIAQAELKVLQDQRDRAQSVYDYAVQNVAQKTQAQLAADLATLKTDFQTKEQAYLTLLKELNGGGTGTSYSTPGMDSNSTASAAVDGAVAGANLLTDLEAANKLLEDKRKALETARASMEASRTSYDSVIKMQVLINNPQLLGQIGELSSDGDKAQDTGLRSDIAKANQALEEKREVLRQQEQKMYELTYEKENALRTQAFYNQTLQKVLEFENIKDNKARLEGILGGSGNLSDKIDSLLSGDNLVVLYGNDLALQIRNSLTQLKSELTDLDVPVTNSVTSFDSQANALKNAADQFPVIDYGQKKQDLVNYLNQMKAARNNLAGVNNLDVSYMGIDRLDQGIGYLESLLADWDDAADGMTDGLQSIQDESADYIAYSSANSGLKGTLAYSDQMLAFSGQLQGGVAGIGQFQSYLTEIGQTKQYLDTVLLDSIQRGGVLVETTLTGSNRTAAQQFFNTVKNGAVQNGQTLQDSFTSINQSFNGLSSALGTFGQSVTGFRSSLEQRNGKVSKVSSTLLSLYESLDSEYQGRKAQLEFLLDQDGDETSLTQISKSLENTRNLNGAKINEKAMEKLIGYLQGLPESERNIDSVYLKVLKDSDARLANLQLGPNELEDRKATELVLDFIKNQSSALARSLASPDYGDFITSLQTQLSSASQIRSFYEGGGSLTETQRNDIRESGTAAERRTLNEYYSFGSTFFFGQGAVSKVSSLDTVVQGFGSFANSVRTGQVLSALRDDYFKAQENKTNGLLKELQTLVPGFNDLTASQLYQDSFEIGNSTDHDTAEEARRRNLLDELLSGLNSNESLLTGLADLDVLKTYYNNATAVKIYGEALNLTSELEQKKTDYSSTIANLAPNLDSAVYPAEDLLNFLSPAVNTYYTGQISASYTLLLSMQNYTDPVTSAQPFIGIDFSGIQSYLTSLQNNLGFWDSKKAGLQATVDTYSNKKTELLALAQGTSEYNAKLAEVTSALTAMNASYNELKGYFSTISADAIQLSVQSQTILKAMKTNAGVPNDKIVTNASTLASLPPNVQSAYSSDPGSFFIVPVSSSDTTAQVVHWEAVLLGNGTFILNTQGSFNQNLVARPSFASIFLNQLAQSQADLDATNNKILNFRNGLDDRIQVFMNQGTQNQISREKLAETVENLRNFFLEKQYNGEQVNSAILEALENAGAFTDEIEKLNFYKSIPVADRTEAKLNTALSDSKSYTTALGDAEKLFQELRGTLSSIEQTGKPLSLSINQINDSLKKYEDLKTKLDGKPFTLDSKIVSGMEALKEFSWENHKSNLVQAFLTHTGDNYSVNQFLNEVKTGKYVLPGNNGTTVQKDAKFLGQDLTAAQLAELTEQLGYYADQTMIQNAGLAQGLGNYLSTQDPDLKAELEQKAVSVGYQRILASLNQGVFSNVSQLPASLTNFAIVSNYTAFLSSKPNWDPTKSADRDAARAEFILRVGNDHGETAILSDYLSNYTSRNASYYLPDFLKETEVLQAYYSRQATDNLNPDDLVSLTTWLQDKKYEPSLVSSLNKAVRMDSILSNYSGENETEYLNYVNSKLSGGLSDAEKEGFFLNQSGAYNPFGSMNPFSELQTNQLLRDFRFKSGFQELADTFGTDGLRLAKAKEQAKRDQDKNQFAYDLVKGNIIVESYLSYLNIGPKGQLEPSQDTQIENRLRELEFQGEHRLGAFMNLVEGYKSFAFDPDKEDQNPSIRRALQDFGDSGYTVRDEVYTKDGSGNYTFMAGINNLKGIIDNYVDNNLPGRSANEDPYSEVGSAKGSMQGSAGAIIDAGKSIGIITNINQTLQGLTGDNLTNKLANQLKTVKDNYLAMEDAFEGAQNELNQQQTAVTNAQNAYALKQTQVTTAYGAFEASQKNLANLSAVYDYAVLANYAQHQNDPNNASVEIAKPTDLAKQRLDAANESVNAKLKEIQDLQTRISKQTTLASLQADPSVAENKQQTQEWAERALRFSQAETIIKDRMQELKSQIAAKRSELQGSLKNLFLPPTATFNENGLDGLIDPNTSSYKNLETKLRGEYSIMEGVLGGKIGFWDFVNGGRGDSNPPRYGGGLSIQYPEYDILGYIRSVNGGGMALSATMQRAQNGFDGMWAWNAGAWGELSAGYRLQNPNYTDYNNAMWNRFNGDQWIQAVTIALMGWGGIEVGLAAITRASAWAEAQSNLTTSITIATNQTNELKALQAKLNYYTDISTGDQLKSVLLGNGSMDSLNTGLTATDLGYLVGSGGKLTADSLKWSTGSGQDLNLDRLAGKNGNTIVQESYVHDAYGLLIRQGKTIPGGQSASSSTYNEDGILTAFMTSGDQISSALAVLAKSQYQIEQREYYAAQEAYVGPGGQKADQKMILDDREGFYANLIQTLSQNTGKNIEYEMYKTVVSDYMGEGKIIDQLYELNADQQKQTQLKAWEEKEKEFYAKKQEWVENIEFLQNTGNARFNDMLSTMTQNWDAWRTDFNEQQKKGEQAHIDAIAKALKEKAEWEKNALASLKNQTSGYEITSAYNQIQGILSSMTASLPTEVALSVNANTILNQVLQNRPAELDASLLQQGANANVQFFVDQLQKTKLDDSNIKGFQDLRKEMDESSKKVVVLQTLDSLWSLPVSFEETIKGANEGLKKQLGDQLLNDEFLPMGDMFVRNVMGPSGDMETQVLPGYNFFQYIKPTKLPELKDSNNRTWDLTNYKALTEEGAPTTTELQSMVKLAREQMAQDFKKTYDPENTSNRETAAIAFDPAAQAKVFQSAQSALQRLFTDPKTALEFAQADDDGKAAMRESAMNSGYLVGPTEGGAFGDHHFQQFFAILKMKEKYNEIKNKGQALQSDPLYKGFEGVGGAGAAKFYVQNKSTINAIDSVLSTIPVVNRINPLAIMKSVVNGGIIGLVTNVASVVTEVVSTVVSTIATAGTATTIVSMDYSYEQGFGAKVDVGVGIGPARISYATIGYSEFGGFEASVGVTGKLGPVEVGARMTYSEKNGFGASASAGVGPFTAGLTYSQQGGLSAAVGYKNANGVVVGLGWSEKGGVSASVGMATKGGYEGGVSFNKDEGFGAYAAKNEFNKNNQITGSKAITFNERDGVGVKITDKDPSGANSGLGIDPHTSVSISQRGGVTVDYENANGFGGSVNVGWNGSYSGSVTQKYDAGTNARGVRTVNFDSEGNFSGSNKTSMISRGSLAGGQDDVDWQNGIALGQGSLMGAMESVSENVAKNYAEMDAAKKAAVIAASKKPGSKIKQADLDNWDTLSEDDKEAIVQKNLSGNESGQHETRTGVWNRLKGAVEDFSDQLSGNYSDDSGWMEDIKDSDGNVIGQKFVNRTCFVAGTLVHTKDGLKKIEEIKVGDVVLSKSDVSGEISYRRVVNTFVRQADAIYKVSFEDGTVLETTWSHRFRILKRDSIGQEFKIGTTEWTQANKLVAGDVTLTVEGETLKVTTILIDQREETVYNFEVEEDHTYFVAEVGIWVHNDAYHSVEVAAWLKYKDSKDPKDLAEFNRIKKRNDRQRIIDRAYSDEDKILLEKKINNEYSQDGELVKSEIKRAIERADEIKDSKLRKIFRNQSIKDTQDEICNVNGMYMMLKEEGANVGSLSDFIIRHVNNGAIVANQENRGYVRIGNFNKFVEGYQINGQNLRLNITDNYSQAFNSGAKMIAAKDPGHMWGMGRDKSNQLFIADPYYNSSNRYSILPNFNQFGRSTHGSHPIVTQYFYIEKEND